MAGNYMTAPDSDWQVSYRRVAWGMTSNNMTAPGSDWQVSYRRVAEAWQEITWWPPVAIDKSPTAGLASCVQDDEYA